MEKTQKKGTVKFFNRKQIPLEMHKVRIVQSLKLVPVERRLEASARQAITLSSWEQKTFFLTC